LLSITHLPQIAAKGVHHIKVYKEDINEVTQTRLKNLTEDERVVEIAQMIGGNKVTDVAIANAKELLN
jgi:DNA repair protein RecN (Recombination protein N)